jgi:hypothetical protein
VSASVYAPPPHLPTGDSIAIKERYTTTSQNNRACQALEDLHLKRRTDTWPQLIFSPSFNPRANFVAMPALKFRISI